VTVASGRVRERDVVDGFAAAGIAATAEVADLDPPAARRLCPLRCDLEETTFVREAS
jgi:hypothetical protein